ncbi:MAG: rane protein [Pseudomonadota bacterium]|jgi:uncharacterized YccA/Bax inhibitor family protein
MRTANPALNDRAFAGVLAEPHGAEVMTVSGTVNKTLLSIIIAFLAAAFVWSKPALASLSMPAAILGLVLALIISFKQTWAPFLTPAYAAVEGVFLGAFSLFAEQFYPGIPAQAVGLTVAVTLCLLFAYKSGAIKATEKFKKGIFAATAGLALFYLGAFIAQLCGVSLPFLTSSSPLSIGFSIVVVIIAALNLVLDFDFIEQAANSRTAPKYLEWYAAFGLLVTLVWLYIEIVRLLMKTKRD